MYVQRNIEARSCDQHYSGKATRFTYSECLFLALVIQHAMNMRHIFNCGLSVCTVFFYYLINGTIFGKNGY